MSKAKLLGRVNTPPDRGNKQRLRWERQNARQEVKRHNPDLCRIWGGVDSGCLQSAIAAGMKRKGRK